LADIIFNSAGIKYEILYTNYDDAISSVQNLKADIAIGLYENEYPNLIYPKWSFDNDNISAMFLKNKNIKWKHEQTLKNKKCGFIQGYSLDKYIQVPVQQFELDTRTELLKMLISGKIDFILDASDELEKISFSEGVKKEDFIIKTVKNIKVFWAFQNSKRGSKLQNIWDQNYKELFFSGRLKPIHEKWFNKKNDGSEDVQDASNPNIVSEVNNSAANSSEEVKGKSEKTQNDLRFSNKNNSSENVKFEIIPNTDTTGIEKVLIMSESWKNWTNTDSTGLVFDLVNSIFSTYGIDVEINYVPYDVSVKNLIEKKTDIAVGVYENEIENIIYPKWNFTIDNISAVCLKNTNTKWNGEKNIENKKCGYIKGYNYDKYFSVSILPVEKETRAELMSALDNHEIDFFLDTVIEIDDYFNSNNIVKNNYEIKHLKNLKIYFGFQNSKKGIKLKDHWDLMFKNYFYNGYFKKFYEKWQKDYNFKILQQ